MAKSAVSASNPDCSVLASFATPSQLNVSTEDPDWWSQRIIGANGVSKMPPGRPWRSWYPAYIGNIPRRATTGETTNSTGTTSGIDTHVKRFLRKTWQLRREHVRVTNEKYNRAWLFSRLLKIIREGFILAVRNYSSFSLPFQKKNKARSKTTYLVMWLRAYSSYHLQYRCKC